MQVCVCVCVCVCVRACDRTIHLPKHTTPHPPHHITPRHTTHAHTHTLRGILISIPLPSKPRCCPSHSSLRPWAGAGSTSMSPYSTSCALCCSRRSKIETCCLPPSCPRRRFRPQGSRSTSWWWFRTVWAATGMTGVWMGVERERCVVFNRS